MSRSFATLLSESPSLRGGDGGGGDVKSLSEVRFLNGFLLPRPKN